MSIKINKSIFKQKTKDYFIKPVATKFELQLLLIFFLSFGFFFGTFLAASDIIPKIFAATSWTQTDWSSGVGSSTTNQYSAGSNIEVASTSGQVTIAVASDWCNNASCNGSWKFRRKITFDNRTANLGVTSEALTNFPVLVKLTSSNIDYSNTQDSGQDIRFVDPDGTDLAYEIEKWDETGTSYVWVKVPSIDINSNTDYVYAYYGNSVATDHQQATSVWDSNFKGVWHLNEASGLTSTDSTSNTNVGTKLSATEPNPTTSGQIGGAQTFDGNNDYVRVGTSSTLNPSAAMTVDAWIYISSNANYGAILARWGAAGNSYFIGTNPSTSQVAIYFSGALVYTTASLPVDQWVNLSITHSGSTVSAYKNGVYLGGGSSGSITASNQYTSIGYDYNRTNYPFTSRIDEVRVSSSARSAAWIMASYKTQTDAFNTYGSEEPQYSSTGTLTSNIYDTGAGQAWGTMSYTATIPTNTTATVKVRAGNSADLSDATAFASCSANTSGADLTGGCTPDNKRYVQYQATLATTDPSVTPTLSDVTINFQPYDTDPPATNASSILMYTSNGGRSVASNGWNNSTTPYFSWTAGADDGGGSGLLGYCLYLGTDSGGDPATSKGILGTTPVSIPSNSNCGFIVSSTSVDLSTAGYIGTALVSGTTYYLNIVAIDNGGNTYTGGSATFHFQHDSTAPTNLAYLTMPSQNFSNVADMNFSWPTSGGSASSDSDAGVLGWQYQINSSSGTWQGTTHDTTLNLDYIPATASAYTLVSFRDTIPPIVSGNNVVYLRTVDSSGNKSSSSTYRTGNLTYGGAAPTFAGDDSVTVTPSTAITNSFALSWPTATASGSNTVAKYYYMINVSPPSTLATLQGNSSVYIDNGTARTVSAAALANVNKGSNTVYVVAIDDASTPNYSPSNDITGTFTLNSTDPDPVQNLLASDSSIKSSSKWNVTLTWDEPSYQGAGNLTYLINRSTDNSTFTQVGTTTGLSYVDNTPASSKYYYKIISKDGASASSADSLTVSLTPTGKYTTAPTLDSGPTASNVTTKRATITWGTSRSSDSKVSYGTASGSYGSDEVSNSTQTSSHTVNLSNLSAGTTYYYIVKWTDEDGNTGTSSEKTFSTDAAPTVKDPKAVGIGLDNVDLQYTVTGASSVSIYYGISTSFGGLKTIDTSTNETTYTTQLTGLTDGTKYYYKINTVDSEDTEYEGSILTFETLPRPKISTVRIQEVTGTAQPTVLVTWTTNTEISSIATYYPSGKPNQSHDQVNVALVKGEHKMLISSLFPQTPYSLAIKGVDKAGNEAISDVQTFTTSTDTRPPAVSNLHVEGGNTNPGDSNTNPTTQLIVSWDTDEPATSQVQFGEGTGSNYSSQTQEDSSLTSNHVVVISGLTPSKVYHLQALSKDKATNQGKSMDTVTITPKATDNALNLVITNLQSVFGFLGGGK